MRLLLASPWLATLLAIVASLGLHAEAATQNAPDPRAGGVRVETEQGPLAKTTPLAPLRQGDVLTLSFPEPLCRRADLERPVATPPVQLVPALPLALRWLTPTELEVRVEGKPLPETAYRLVLADAVKTAAGRAFAAPAWGLVWQPEPFTVSHIQERWSEEDAERLIGPTPKLKLKFSHPVEGEEVARTCVWRDENGDVIPADVLVPVDQESDAGRSFTVVPRRTLGAGHRYDVLVEGTRCVLGGTRLPRPFVFQAGRTVALHLKSLQMRVQPKVGAFLALEFNQSVDPSSISTGTVRVEPEVAWTKVDTSGVSVRLLGDFKKGMSYKVTLSPRLRSEAGFPLEHELSRVVTVGHKRPAVSVSASRVTTTPANDLKIDLVQVNTGALHWSLASVPTALLTTVNERTDEFGDWGYRRDDSAEPGDELSPNRTELLVPTLRLPVVQEGTLPASSDDEETPRAFAFARELLKPGTYLLEIAGPTPDGRVAGNRILVFVNQTFVVWKDTATERRGRLFDVQTGETVPGALVQFLGDSGETVAQATSDAEGNVVFLEKDMKDSRGTRFLVNVAGQVEAHFGKTGWWPRYSWERDDSGPGPERLWLFSDRSLYRPGETLHVQAVGRLVKDDGSLAFPTAGTAAPWKLLSSASSEPVLEGVATWGPTGNWEATVELPAALPLGHYHFESGTGSCDIKVDEYRAPAFSVETAAEEDDTGKAQLRVRSHYFHGAPNAKALVRWRARWTEYSPEPQDSADCIYYSTTDWVSPTQAMRRSRSQELETQRPVVMEGSATLDPAGAAELVCAMALPDTSRAAFAHVDWELSVVGPDGQTVDAAASQIVKRREAQPAVSLTTVDAGRSLRVETKALDAKGGEKEGLSLRLELFQVSASSVREQLSPHVARYRNTPIFTPLLTQELKAPQVVTVPAPASGRYVAVVSLGGEPSAPRASAETYVFKSEAALFPQEDDQVVALKTDAKSYHVGDTMQLHVLAPFGGRAWVTVETDRVLSSRLVTLENNATPVDIPVTREMFPNAYVSVYLLRPGKQGVPAERVGVCEVSVKRQDTELDVRTRVEKSKVEPRELVNGTVVVSSLGRPVAGAELTVFAVDDAVLTYGRWKLGDPAEVFFPRAAHRITTRSTLADFFHREEPYEGFQKGFLLGDGAGLSMARFQRTTFKNLAFWKCGLVTDAEGRATFSFEAPDNLTAYRIVAVAQSGTEAFGSGQGSVEVARALQAEPALPRFVRDGDVADLRVVVRQTRGETIKASVCCAVDGGTLEGPGVTHVDLRQGEPLPLIFRTRVGSVGQLRVAFTVKAEDGSDLGDAVAVDVPVRPATVLRSEAISGTIPHGAWLPASAFPKAWLEASGVANVVLSSSPWMPVAQVLPSVLDYPHGCCEQVSSRVLSFALMAGALRDLPDGEAREGAYRLRVTQGLSRLQRAQLTDGAMPYWPGSKEPNAFVTLQTAWAASEATRGGFVVPKGFSEKLAKAVQRILRRQQGEHHSTSLRTFALFVAANLRSGKVPAAEALELFERRDELGDDGRAMLALALHRLNLLPEAQGQLLAELGTQTSANDFDREWFNSDTRTRALVLCARAELKSLAAMPGDRAALSTGLQQLVETSGVRSTQENLWTLLAFRSLLEGDAAEAKAPAGPEAGRRVSRDGQSSGWQAQALTGIAQTFSQEVSGPGTFWFEAEYRTPVKEQRSDHGFRIERVVRNLTEPQRDGSAEAPFVLGDEVRMTFRVLTERDHAYVALEESLPAAFETIDPEYYSRTHARLVEASVGDGPLALSHWEKRDDRSEWYFDSLPAGAHTFSVMVRVTSTGTFRWPGAKVEPMYDARSFGVGEGTEVVVR